MDLNDFSVGQIWSIVPERLDALMERFREVRLSPELAAQAAAFIPKRPDPESRYTLQDGVAIIPITGPLTKRVGWLSLFFGGTGYAMIGEAVTAALNDPAVKAIVYDIDSPGGTVSGTEALGELIYESRAIKPSVAFANGTMASAAYWTGSAATSIVSENTAQVGSIGVLMVHYDFSRMDERIGLRRTYLTAGKYKALGNDAEPLSQAARDEFESQLNQFYQPFVASVARNRGTDAQTVQEKMADGRIFIGKQAVEAGLVDRIGNLQTAVDLALSLAGEGTQKKSYYAGGVTSRKEKVMSEKTITVPTTVGQLAAMYPDLIAQVQEQAAKSVNLEPVRAEAAKVEGERILGLVMIQYGEESGTKFKAVVESGTTVESYKAFRAMNPPEAKTETDEDKKKAEILAAIQKSGADNPGAGKTDTASGKDFLTLVDECVAVDKISKGEAVRKVASLHPDKHQDYIKKSQLRLAK
jgi:signal peptide peptidase SppA